MKSHEPSDSEVIERFQEDPELLEVVLGWAKAWQTWGRNAESDRALCDRLEFLMTVAERPVEVEEESVS